MLAHMTGAVGILIKLGIRLVVFTAVFFAATKYNDRISVSRKWVFPLVGSRRLYTKAGSTPRDSARLWTHLARPASVAPST